MIPALYCAAFAFVLMAAVALLIFYVYSKTRVARASTRHDSVNHLRQRARHILDEARQATKRSRVPKDRKAALNNEARELYDHIANGIWKLERVRKIRELALKGPASADSIRIVDEADAMESHLMTELNRALDVLLSVPASLIKVEVAQSDRVIDHLIENLDETNVRMRDVADAYDDIHSQSYSHSKV